jgi:hypothetical protein
MEVVATVRFVTPCLGNVRGERLDCMLRGRDGRVLLLQSWWRSGLGYAAQALCRWVDEVGQIQTAPEVDGRLEIYRRFYGPKDFKEHEAFLAGREIMVKFCLPPKMTLEDFRELLSVAGQYVGISPYGYKQDYGRFEVVDVKPYRRSHDGESHDHPARQPDRGVPGLPPHLSARIDVHAAHTDGGHGGVSDGVPVPSVRPHVDGAGGLNQPRR